MLDFVIVFMEQNISKYALQDFVFHFRWENFFKNLVYKLSYQIIIKNFFIQFCRNAPDAILKNCWLVRDKVSEQFFCAWWNFRSQIIWLACISLKGFHRAILSRSCSVVFAIAFNFQRSNCMKMQFNSITLWYYDFYNVKSRLFQVQGKNTFFSEYFEKP